MGLKEKHCIPLREMQCFQILVLIQLPIFFHVWLLFLRSNLQLNKIDRLLIR